MNIEHRKALDLTKSKLNRTAHTFYIDWKEKLSTFFVSDSGIVEKPQKRNNQKQVLDVLHKKFNLFRSGICKDLPNEAVGNVVKRTLRVDTFLDFIRKTERPAIINPPSHANQALTSHITHREIHTFIEKSFNLTKFNIFRGDRVAVCLPEGPVLNLCLLSTMAYCTCVPSNFKLTTDELLNDYKQLRVKAVIVPYDKLMCTEDDDLAVRFRQIGLQLIGLKTASDTDIKFTLVADPLSNANTITRDESPRLNEANDVVMLIQTSGTTGQKKIVPYRLQTLCISTVCVIFSLDVKDTDTIINMMPLFHIGGIIRNLLTPVFSGGSIIQCQGFDPVLFCDILENQKNPIWFYGVPSMQQNIIQVAAMRKLSTKCCNLVKKICNAGAALSPTLAKEIKSIFTQAVVLPSYGMTECMPICAPPCHYGLELEGTSGQVIGPDLAVSVDNKITCNENIIGHIMVRGGPCFDGYEGIDNSETFDKDGFFDTGDMGYIKNGYVYITGRSKEVINRGGEILSPLEIENELIKHPKVAQVMAFSMPHETLQETVGCVIVTRDPHIRPDLRSLRTFLDKKLHSTKHPQLLVYMKDLPKSNVGKVLRINFSSRLNISSITSEATSSELLYEAHCTTSGTTIKVNSCRAVEWSVNDVVEVVRKYPQIKACAGYRNSGKFILLIASKNDVIDELVPNIEKYLRSKLHDYMLPTDFIVVEEHVLNDWESADEKHLADIVNKTQKKITDPVTLVLRDIFGLAVGMPKESDGEFPVNGNFFEYGGNSLKIGFLMSIIRTKLGVSLSAATIYEEDCQTPAGLAVRCRERMPKDHILLMHGYDRFKREEDDDHNHTDLNKNFNNSAFKERMKSRPLSGAKNPFNPLVMLVQASPFYLMQPIAHISRWTIFVYILLYVSSTIGKASTITLPNFFWVLLSMTIVEISISILFPLFGILMKWLVIGRYRAGTYPLWGEYYLRWWFINKLLVVTDLGIFKLHPKLYVLYLRLMGATVGSNTVVSIDANFREYDLITIGSDCYIDDCAVRPFQLAYGHMSLKNIVVGNSCVLGFRTNIVAGTTLANGTVIGPQTTTYRRDMKSGSSAHADTAEGMKLRDLCRETFPLPHCILQCVVGWPIVIITHIASNVPWFYCLFLLTKDRLYRSSPSVAELIVYFSQPNRICFYLLAITVRNYVVPLLYIILIVLIKRLIIGKFEAGPRKLDQLSLMKHWLMTTLLSKDRWQLISHIIGANYEGISVIYRLLGAQVGKRVYWPGTNLRLVEFDLLTVGDDVVFGSRSQIVCGDAREFARITIDDGAMCADNCVILPGARIGRNAILGTGGLLKKHFNLADGSVWYGSLNGNAVKFRDGTFSKKVLPNVEKIGASNATIISMGSYDEDTSRPFGRAFYERKANYFVFPLAFIMFYNAIFLLIGTILWSMPKLAAIQIATVYIRSTEVVVSGITLHNQSVALLFLLLFCSYSVAYVVTTILSLTIEIIAKWMLVGRRKPGTYNWDESSYCQRWKMLTGVGKIGRANTIKFMGGSSWITLFFRALGCRIGRRVCLYPNDGDPVMVEPDLVVLEDDVAVDKASLICHLNTLGEFSLNQLWVGAGSIIQNDSRLAPGATMLEDCTLLERSYIIQGEIAESNSVWQGYPAVSTHLHELVNGNEKM